MLGKLLKQEFRATGRIMLPVFGALLLLSVLGNVSIRMLNFGLDKSPVLTFLFMFLIVAFGLGVFATMFMTLWLMITRFYRNLLKEEGYLMHTLPVSVHSLVWSKLIVSLCWFLAAGLVIFLITGISTLIQSGTDLARFLQGFPSWSMVKAALAEEGIRMGDLWLMLLEGCVLALVGFFAICLHFYAAMAMGHMFNKDKVLLSIVFFVGLSFVMNLFTSMSGVGVVQSLMVQEVETTRVALALVHRTLLFGTLIEAVQATALYYATTLSLRRGLNLA